MSESAALVKKGRLINRVRPPKAGTARTPHSFQDDEQVPRVRLGGVRGVVPLVVVVNVSVVIVIHPKLPKLCMHESWLK